MKMYVCTMNQFRNHERNSQLNEFQKIAQERFMDACEIFYENSVHKKFLADVYAVIPKGKKCALWFTQKQVWMFQIAKRPYIEGSVHHGQLVSFDNVRMLSVPCTDESWYEGKGTILYGTQLVDKKRFSVENVHYLCGVKQDNDGSMNRFIHFFEHLKKSTLATYMPFQFFMPIMHTTFSDALNDAINIKTYEVYSIQHRFLKRDCSEFKNLLFHLAQTQPEQNPKQTNSLFFPKQSHAQPQTQTQTQTQTQLRVQQTQPIHSKKPQLRTFFVKADIQNDIYYVLYRMDEPIAQNTMIAHIPNYKTSVMMNSIFRNIKENRNLDALEESDDEDEISDPGKKLVDLDKCVKMECAFNLRFKRWHPIAVC